MVIPPTSPPFTLNVELQTDFSYLTELHVLINRAYRGIDGQGRWTTEHHLVEGERIRIGDLKQLILSDDVSFFAGFRNNYPVCCIAVKQFADRLELGTFAVEPSLHGQGIGSSLLDYTEKAMHHHGIPYEVNVVTDNTNLIAFYQRRGYQDNGVKQAYPVARHVGIPKMPGLTLSVLTKAV